MKRQRYGSACIKLLKLFLCGIYVRYSAISFLVTEYGVYLRQKKYFFPPFRGKFGKKNKFVSLRWNVVSGKFKYAEFVDDIHFSYSRLKILFSHKIGSKNQKHLFKMKYIHILGTKVDQMGCNKILKIVGRTIDTFGSNKNFTQS